MDKFSSISKISFFNLLMDSDISALAGSRYVTAQLSLSKSKKILTGNDLGQLNVWDSDTYSLCKTIQISSKAIILITKISKANRIVVASFNSYLTLLDSVSFISSWRFKCQFPILCSRGIQSTYINVSSLGKVTLFTIIPFEPVHEFSIKNSDVAEIEFCIISRVIIFACRNKRSLVYSLDNYEELASNVHESGVWTVCISHVSRVYATGESSGLICVFNLSDVKVLLLTVNTKAPISQLKFINKGKHLISLDKSKKIAIREIENLSTTKEFQVLDLAMKNFQLLDKNTKISCLFEDGTISVVQLSNKKVLGEIFQVFKDINSLYSTPKNSQLLIYDKIGNLVLWDRSETKRFSRLFLKKDLSIRKICITRKSIAVSDDNLKILVFKNKKN